MGLDAQGVDPLAALHNPAKLDVRDTMGRPVSAQKVAAELKQANAAAASQATYSSTLPQAAAVAALLEMLQTLRLMWRGGETLPTPFEFLALAPSAGPSLKVLALVLLVLAVGALKACRCRTPSAVKADSRSRLPKVLRC